MKYSEMPFIKEVFEKGYGKPPTEDESRVTYDVALEILKERGHHFGIGDSRSAIEEPLKKYLKDDRNSAEFYRRLEQPLSQLLPVGTGSEDSDNKRGRDRGAAPVSIRSGRPPTPPPAMYKPPITEAERKKRLREILEEDEEEKQKVLARPPV